MALFAKKENNEETTVETPVVPVVVGQPAVVNLDVQASRSLVVPRLSEKAGQLSKLNKYIFTIWGQTNKIEVRKNIEARYGVKIAQVNMVTMAGKTRRFGRRYGVTKNFKKAIVTLTANSKKIDLVEPS